MLRPWQEYLGVSTPDWKVFSRQLVRWRFRDWQQDNRGIGDDDGEFLAYVEAWNRRNVTYKITWPRITEQENIKVRDIMKGVARFASMETRKPKGDLWRWQVSRICRGSEAPPGRARAHPDIPARRRFQTTGQVDDVD
jgi:hypothetical protein